MGTIGWSGFDAGAGIRSNELARIRLMVRVIVGGHPITNTFRPGY